MTDQPGIIKDPDALLAHCLQAMCGAEGRYDRMRRMTDLLWDQLAPRGLSWVGFYIANPEAPESERLILGPRRNAPACSPIGVHGACGQALCSGRAVVVEDVATLGKAYIACDPRDKSELVVPCRESQANVWGVLDLDSHSVGRFSEVDATSLDRCLCSADLSQ